MKEFSEAIHEREYWVARVLSPEALKIRWTFLNYKPKPIQLKLF